MTVPKITYAWVTCQDSTLSVEDKSSLRKGDDLNDKHINFGQNFLIKRQLGNSRSNQHEKTLTPSDFTETW